MSFRKLRIALSATCGILCLLLIALSVRSYSTADTVVCRYGAPKAIRFQSRLGQIRVATILDQPQLWSGWSATFSFTPTRPTWEPAYYSVELINGRLASWDKYFQFASVETGFPIRCWCVAVSLAALSVRPWLCWQFSLRALLIATTLISVALGLIVYGSK
jgi:hypothetical protein